MDTRRPATCDVLLTRTKRPAYPCACAAVAACRRCAQAARKRHVTAARARRAAAGWTWGCEGGAQCTRWVRGHAHGTCSSERPQWPTAHATVLDLPASALEQQNQCDFWVWARVAYCGRAALQQGHALTRSTRCGTRGVRAHHGSSGRTCAAAPHQSQTLQSCIARCIRPTAAVLRVYLIARAAHSGSSRMQALSSSSSRASMAPRVQRTTTVTVEARGERTDALREAANSMADMEAPASTPMGVKYEVRSVFNCC